MLWFILVVLGFIFCCCMLFWVCIGVVLVGCWLYFWICVLVVFGSIFFMIFGVCLLVLIFWIIFVFFDFFFCSDGLVVEIFLKFYEFFLSSGVVVFVLLYWRIWCRIYLNCWGWLLWRNRWVRDLVVNVWFGVF